MNPFLTSYHFPIDGGETIDQVNKRFNRNYPDLHLNFYKTPRNQEKCSFSSIIYFSDVRMKEINSSFSDGAITLTASTTIRDLEHMLFVQFGISVQVSRIRQQTGTEPEYKKSFSSESLGSYFQKTIRRERKVFGKDLRFGYV